MSNERPHGALRRIADAMAGPLLARPRLTLAVSLIVGAVSAVIASGIDFDTRLSALLPESAPEVKELDTVRKKAGGTVELVIAIGGERAARLPFARELVEALAAKPWIRRADAEFPTEFFLDRRAWLLSADALKKLHDKIEAEIERAKARANPFYVDLEEDDEVDKNKKDAWAEVDSTGTPKDMRALLKRTFTSNDGRYLFVRVKPKVVGFELGESGEIFDRVKAVVAGLAPEKRGLRVRYAGNLPVNQEQHRRMQSDMRRSSIYALVLVLLLTTLYIRRLAAMVVLAVPLVIGVLVTLAITALTVGQLNLVSGFLVSALIGLGIAFGVHLYMRYLEYLAVAESREVAMRQAFVNTFPGCFTAAATTAAAFLTMTISDFRGFREYGEIAGGGVLLTLLATFVALPPLAMMLSRRKQVHRRMRWTLQVGFSRSLAVAMVVAGVALLGVSLAVLPQVGWHNDFKKLRGDSDAVAFAEYAEASLGGSLSPAAIMVEDIDQSQRVEEVLEPYTRGAASPLLRYVSLASLVPRDVEKKRKILAGIEETLRDVRQDKLTDEDRKKIDEALELVTIAPWTEGDIPDVFRRLFRSLDGKNAFVIAWPRSNLYLDEELFAWAETLAEIQGKLRARGVDATVLDENRISARVVREVEREWPKVFSYAAIAVVVLLILDFRSPRKVLLLSVSLAFGLMWIVGGMYVSDVYLNIFNHSALPTILGIGIDNAVHVQHRYDLEGPGSIPRVVSTTGSAALLASTTTAIGFGTTMTAHHAGVNSLGVLAVIGIASTFVGSTIFFPSLLRLLEGRRQK